MQLGLSELGSARSQLGRSVCRPGRAGSRSLAAASVDRGGPGLIAALIAKPSAYYVNVHTEAYRNGAIRGQLGRWKLMSVDAQGALECGVGT